MGMYVYISQRKYIPYLTSIHALSPYELSHTIIPVTCVYNWFNNGYNHFICTSSIIIFILCTFTYIYSTKSPIQILSYPISYNNVHFNFNGISHISVIGLVPSKTWLRLTPRGPALRVETHFPSQLHAVAKRPSGLRVTSHVIQTFPH